MSTSSKQKRESDREASRARRVSKKDQIISLYTSGIGEVEDLAMITGSRPSYVANVLQESGLMTGYFDLYTTSAHPMNVYSKFFAKRLGFKDESGARLAFTCARKICRVMLVDSVEQVPALRDMGPEPGGKGFSLAYLERVIEESPARQIKPLLMDQKKIAGVGNIYADEILFEAKVRPDRRARELTEEEIKRVHRETRRVLRKAIKTGGDENFPSYFLVSRSARGANCKACNSEIERKTIGGRTAYFCPQCQS